MKADTLKELLVRIDHNEVKPSTPVCGDLLFWHEQILGYVHDVEHLNAWTKEDTHSVITAIDSSDQVRNAIWEVIESTVENICSTKQYPIDGEEEEEEE